MDEADLIGRVVPVPPLLTGDELEALTSIKKSWLLAQARANRIPHIRAGKYVRFEFPSVMRFLQEQAASLLEQS